MGMQESELGSATYQNGAIDGDLSGAAAQLNSGDTAKAKFTFPMPISFIPGDWLTGALGPLFAAAGQNLTGADFEGDSTLVLTWTVG